MTGQGGREMELYLHLPFCVRKCAYCDFLSFPADPGKQRWYVEALKREIREAGERYAGRSVSTVFIGGGTPSALDSALIRELFDSLRESFSIRPDAEISMEANPGTVNRKKLLDYRRAGINRLSFGLQSADNGELSRLGRIHTWETFLESFRLAREQGFFHVNVDLMSALPGQTVESWAKTLKRTADLGPEHISAYSLILEEGTPFYERYAVGDAAREIPDEEADREMYHWTREFLCGAGYERYEISNYARPGEECRHNIGYWTGVPYLGLGLGAASYMDGVRFSNTRDFSAYLAGEFSDRASVQVLTEQEKQEEFFYLGLRMVRGVSLREFKERFGVDARAVYPGVMERFIEENVARMDGERFCLTEYGLDVCNVVMAEFLQG